MFISCDVPDIFIILVTNTDPGKRKIDHGSRKCSWLFLFSCPAFAENFMKIRSTFFHNFADKHGCPWKHRKRKPSWLEENAGLLLIWYLGTNFSGILIEIHTFLFRKMHLKMSSGKWRPFCLGLNEFTKLEHGCILHIHYYGYHFSSMS